MSSGWEDRAQQWLRWAREPDFDPYWYFEDEYAALVPPPAGPALDIGCGEGRTTRALAKAGHDVLGIDASPTLLAAAREAHPDGGYMLCDASELPFEDSSFALVSSYNVLMDVDDPAAVVGEAARVLRPGGALCLCVTHPVSMAGSFEGGGEHPPFVIPGSYRATERYEEPFEVDGISMFFDGTRHSLESYARMLEQAGLLIAAVREPAPGRGHPARLQPFHRVPMFLMLRAKNPPF